MENDDETEKIKNASDKSMLIFTCSFCGQKNFNSNFLSNEKKRILQKENKDDICQNCKNYFTKCSVCLCPLKLSKDNSVCIIYCTKCCHGGHYEHYQGWFNEFNECPNSKCNCRCQEDNRKSFAGSSSEN